MQLWRDIDVLRAAAFAAGQVEYRAMLLALDAVAVRPSTAPIDRTQTAPQHFFA
jgi:hypothetical protein